MHTFTYLLLLGHRRSVHQVSHPSVLSRVPLLGTGQTNVEDVHFTWSARVSGYDVASWRDKACLS